MNASNMEGRCVRYHVRTDTFCIYDILYCTALAKADLGIWAEKV
jgi:hypothetical protein